MKPLLFGLALVVAGVVGLGFFQGWFHIGSDEAEGKSNVTLSVDKEKFQEDKTAAIANVKGVGRQIKDKVAGSGDKTMDGTVVSVSGDKLVMTNKDGKEHSHSLAANIKVTCDGRPCTVTDLKAGMRIRVTPDSADRDAAARIEALDKDSAFASKSHEGKTVRVTNNTLVMTIGDGAEEHTYTLVADVKVSCDGKACKTDDLKPGMKIRVTTENPQSHAATRIEALDTKETFEKGI